MGGAPKRKKDNFWSEIYVGSNNSSKTSSTRAASRQDSVFTKLSGTTVTKVTTSSGVDFLHEDGKPESKASLGRMHYNLKYLPSLLFVDVDVTTKESVEDDDGGIEVKDVIVQSRRLRHLALKDFIASGAKSRNEEVSSSSDEGSDNAGGEEIEVAGSFEHSKLAFDLEARFDGLDILKGHAIDEYQFATSPFGRTNRIIIPVKDRNTAINVLGKLEKTKKLTETKKQKKLKAKRANPKLEDDPVTCTVVRKGIFIDPSDAEESVDRKELYRHGLQLLFQQQDRPATSRTDEHIAFEAPDGTVWVQSKDRTIHSEAPWGYGVRYKSIIDRSYRLCISFDLVPVLERDDSVSKYITYHFPESFPVEHSGIRKIVKRLLQGLRVRYPFSKEISQHYSNVAQTHGWKYEYRVYDEEELQGLVDRVYTIKDVKYHSDVGQSITVDKLAADGSTETKHFTVKDYLELFHAAIDKKSQHLPLVDIGKTAPLWVPLNLLFFSDDQVPPHTGHLTAELKRLRGLISAEKIAELGEEVVKGLNSRSNSPLQFEQPKKPELSLPFPASYDTPYQPLVSVSPEEFGNSSRKRINGAAPLAKVSVMYITPKISSPTTEEFLENVYIALATESEKDFCNRILDISRGEISTNSIRSASELFRLQDKSRSIDMERLINPISNVFIGIIDGESMTTEKYKDAAAEIKRLGDRRLGAVTIAIDDRQLKERFQSDRITLPENILRKIRFMLGSMNFDWDDCHFSETIDIKYRNGLIVVGAHISQPDSTPTEMCPAVASIVASKASNPSFYRSIARVQIARECVPQTYDEDVPADVQKTPKLAHFYRPGIEDLQNIMRVIFEDWAAERKSLKDQREEHQEKPRVVFYRDSCDATNREAHENESNQIMEAYKAVFMPEVSNSDVPLSYITVQKNNRCHTPALKDGVGKRDVREAPFSFTTSEYKEDDIKHIRGDHRREEDGAKYQYHVHVNNQGSEMTLGKLKDLVSNTIAQNFNACTNAVDQSPQQQFAVRRLRIPRTPRPLRKEARSARVVLLRLDVTQRHEQLPQSLERHRVW